MIECFEKVGSEDLKTKFENLIKDRPENEHLRIAKELVMQEHEKLHNDNEAFKKKIDKKYPIKPYIGQPDKTADIEKINSEYQTKIDETKKAAEVLNTETKTSATDTGANKVEQPTEEGEGKTVGASHEALGKLATRLGLEQPEAGTFLTPKDQLERGRVLLKGGANPQEVADNFKKDGKVSADEISVARAHQEILTKAADKALKDFGKNSEQFKTAKDELQKWNDSVIKPMGTSSGAAFSALQGETDLDTGSFLSVKKAVEERTGKELTPEQEKAITELTDRYNSLSKEHEDLQKKFTDLVDKAVNEVTKTKEKTKKSSGDFAKERKDAFQAARDALKKLRSGQSGLGVTVPFARELVAIAPHVGKIVKSLIEEGVDKLADIVDRIHDEFKDDIKGLRRRDIIDVIAGEYGKKTEDSSPEIDKLSDIKKQAKLTKKLQDLQEGLPEDYDKNKTQQSPEVKELLEKINKVKDDLAAIDYMKNEKTSLHTQFADKTDNKFTPEQVKDIWDYAKKNYIDKGRTVNEMIKGVAIDLGLTSKQILSALEQPKGAKVISDKMYLAQSRRLKAANTVKEYAQTANESKLVKWAKAIPNFFFQKAIFGHGTVGMITHAGMNIFRPSIAKIYFPLFLKQFKNSFGSLTEKGNADYTKSMEYLKNDPLFAVAKRAGVKVDPTETNDDYFGVKKWLGKVGMIGDRGFNTLKEFRMAMFKNEYNRLSDVEKADPATLKEIGKIINHATGTSDFQPGGFMNTAIFAPRLEASKWARIVTDPAKAITTFSKWGNSTMAEKAAAKIVARKSGELLATYIGALAVNQALLYAMGSKQTVNYTDPTKKDYMKFKMGDEVIDLSGGIIPTIGFAGHLLAIPFASKETLKGKTRSDELMKTGWDYGTSKASPFAGTAKDILTAHDFMGNTMPWSNDKPKNQYAHKLTWKEYLFSQQAPIPLAEAAKDMYRSMEDRGMSELQINDVMTGLVKGAISGGTGAKVGEDYSLKNHAELFNSDDLKTGDLKFITDKGVKVLVSGSPSQHKIEPDAKHPLGVMTADEFEKYNQIKREEIEKGIKVMLKDNHQVTYRNDEGEVTDSKEILGRDLEKEEMQKRVNAISEAAAKTALEKLHLKAHKGRNVTVKSLHEE